MADPEGSRRLTAILAADAAGYSRLMQGDDRGTVATLDAYRGVFREHIEAHEGRIVDMAGDSILAVFDSPTEAVCAAFVIQSVLAERNEVLPEERRMRFRIGVNLGEVISKTDGTVYGDGVNIAARLQSIAEPGGVMVSGTVFDQVKNRLHLSFDFIGEQEVKNIAEPVRIYRLIGEGREAGSKAANRTPSSRRRSTVLLAAIVVLSATLAGGWYVTHSRLPADPVLALPTGPSIAVLPFVNLSGDPAQDYFSDGLTEQIITALARFRGLYVIARNSTFQYKGRALDVREVGRELGARYVLEGSVRRAGKTLRVTAQLLDAQRGAHLWAETYDRGLTGADIFALQDDITSSVVANIAGPHGQISQTAVGQTTRKAPESIDSYDCVLRAYVWNRVLSRESHGPLRDCLEAAVARDPEYGEAWAWLAFSYLFEYEAGYNPRPELYDARDRALEAGLRAVELDPNNAGVHANMSYVRFVRREFDASLASAERALVLNPNDPAVLCQAGQKMVYAGIQADRGIALTKKAMALGPHYPPWCHYHLSYFHYKKGEYEQALAESLKIDLPQLFWTQVFLAMNYGQLGRQREAKAALAKLAKLYPDFGKNARREWGNYIFTDSEIEHANDGLRKAGLDIPPEKK